ncbi:LysR family transcriptional regulator [Streptomyces sp. NPDC001848]|uniref:helix-turn-helix domain-containing protein n=1 Tax=Streptomyces sp. NPDC001848 TaxID=3364618 RepID=UPI00369EDD3A
MDISSAGLRVLRQIAESGSFTAAAARLGYTQSAVSRQAAALEHSTGATLFERRPDGVRLTPAGLTLGQVRARLVRHVQDATGWRMTPAQAEALLERAKAWVPGPARQLDTHLAEQPDAWSAPSRHCPVTLVRLASLLDEAGFGDAITRPRYVRCDRTASARCASAAGRIAEPALRTTPSRTSSVRETVPVSSRSAATSEARTVWACRSNLIRALRAGSLDLAVLTSRPPHRPFDSELPRLHLEAVADTELVVTECAGCGHKRAPGVRLDDSTVLCTNCVPRPERECTRCGTPARHKNTDDERRSALQTLLPGPETPQRDLRRARRDRGPPGRRPDGCLHPLLPRSQGNLRGLRPVPLRQSCVRPWRDVSLPLMPATADPEVR